MDFPKAFVTELIPDIKPLNVEIYSLCFFFQPCSFVLEYCFWYCIQTHSDSLPFMWQYESLCWCFISCVNIEYSLFVQVWLFFFYLVDTDMFRRKFSSSVPKREANSNRIVLLLVHLFIQTVLYPSVCLHVGCFTVDFCIHKIFLQKWDESFKKVS